MRRHETPTWAFGGSSHSVSDVEDLTAAKDVAMRNVARHLQEVSGLRVPFDLSSVTAAYQGLVTRYTTARAAAQKAIDDASSIFHPMPKALTDATATYEGLLDALNPQWRENTWTPGGGSLEDVESQLSSMGATSKTDEVTPQPKAFDASLSALQAAAAVTTMAEGAASGAGTLLGKGTKGLLGSLDTATLVKVGIVVGVGLFLLPKFFPLRALVR